MPRAFLVVIGLLLLAPRNWLAAAAPEASAKRGPVQVRVVQAPGGWRLERDGKPYFVRGIGGSGSLELAARCGANTLRTWGVEGLDKILDEAHRQGLMVAAGIWLGHERHGFDWSNADQVAEQSERVCQAVLRYKDHPALLLWGLGNEMEGYGAGDNAAIWGAINNLAAQVKKLDPHHPTMTVVAEIGGQRVKNFQRLCPAVDLLGINSYAGATSIPQRYRAAGGTKPYLLTEFGPPGAWETQPNAWGAKPELSSTAKAARYRAAWQQGVLAAPDLALGGFAFLWGTKQEASATWFGMLLPDGSRLAAADVMTELWTGQTPANRCPTIEKLEVVGADQVDPGAAIRVKLSTSDPDRDPLAVKWVLQAEPESFGIGGDAETPPPIFPAAITASSATECAVKLPTAGGFRLFAYVRDGQGGAAVANVPLQAHGVPPLVPAATAQLPLILYDEASQPNPPYIPSGWMGNTKALKLTLDCPDRPQAGVACLKAEFSANDGWGGVVWQSPAGDWGDRPGGWNWTGAKRLAFYARGAAGGETIRVEFGLLKRDKRYHDTAHGKLDAIKLSDRWQEYAIDLAGQDLTRIKTGFCFTVTGNGQPVVFYLDRIRVE